jgi:hypothetical protein
MYMLQQDNSLRLSEETQNLYNQLDHPNDTINIINVIQQVAIRRAFDHFGIEANEKQRSRALQILHSVRTLFPNDKEVYDCAHYLKYNRMFQAKPLSDGDKLDVDIIDRMIYHSGPRIDFEDQWLLISGSLS